MILIHSQFDNHVFCFVDFGIKPGETVQGNILTVGAMHFSTKSFPYSLLWQ